MSSNTIRIERLENGYTVEVTDPKIRAANAKPKAVWRDPCKEYAFKDLKAACKWIMENGDMMEPGESDEMEFAGGWNEAVTKGD